MREKTRLIGLGNTILGDDAVGILTVRQVGRRLVGTPVLAEMDVVELESGGFELMERMHGWRRVILVDSIHLEGIAEGAVLRMQVEELRTMPGLRSVHEVSLPTALELGRRLGLDMPSELAIFAIQVSEIRMLGRFMTASVVAGMNRAVDLIVRELSPAAALGKAV